MTVNFPIVYNQTISINIRNICKITKLINGREYLWFGCIPLVVHYFVIK